MGVLTQADVSILNEKVVIGLTPSDPLNNIVIMQCNKTRHLINCLQIERFDFFVGHDIVIFLAQHSCTKREEREAILQKDLFSIQDKDCRATGLGLLYYCKEMSIALLTNICIALGMVNCKEEVAHTKLGHVQAWSRATPRLLSVIG